MDKLKQLKLSDQLIAGGTILFLITGVLTWFSFDLGGFDLGDLGDVSGFSAGALWWLALVLMVAGAAFALLPTFAPQVSLPEVGGLSQAMLTGILAAAGGGLGVIRFLAAPSGYDRAIGAFIGVVAAVAVIVGGVFKLTNREPAGTGGPTA